MRIKVLGSPRFSQIPNWAEVGSFDGFGFERVEEGLELRGSAFEVHKLVNVQILAEILGCLVHVFGENAEQVNVLRVISGPLPGSSVSIAVRFSLSHLPHQKPNLCHETQFAQ
jgi:hypothetical protein